MAERLVPSVGSDRGGGRVEAGGLRVKEACWAGGRFLCSRVTALDGVLYGERACAREAGSLCFWGFSKFRLVRDLKTHNAKVWRDKSMFFK